MLRLILTIGLVATFGCGGPPPAPTTAQRARAECSATLTGDYFFPDGSLAVTPAGDEAVRSVTSRLLIGAMARSLSCGPSQSAQAYRLAAYSAFGIKPVVVSLTENESGWSLRAVELRSLTDLTVNIEKTRTLSRQEAQALAESIRESRFWNTPGPRSDPPVLDGSTWVLEGRRDSAYHVVRRTLPEDSIRAFVVTLVRLAQLPPSSLLD